MKNLIITLFIFSSASLLAGCCTDDVSCGTTASYVTTSSCNACTTCSNNCSSTCNTCGTNTMYTYSGWY